MADLTLHVKDEYFGEMLVGIKTREYRLCTDHWRKRIDGRNYDRLIICNGYPRRDDHNKRLVLPWLGYELQTITHKHFGDAPVEVFAIIVQVAS
jgi:hypothetical protein